MIKINCNECRICRVRRLDAPLPRERHKILEMSIATVRRGSPCGCPLSVQPIQRFKQADKTRFLNFCKVKVSDSSNIYNQASNSRAAVFDKPFEAGEGTACAARRTSPYCLSEASLRANVPSCRLRAASYVLRRGVAGVQGRSPQKGRHTAVLRSKTACT